MSDASVGLGSLISKRRRELGLTQEHLARSVGIGTSTLRLLESGRAAGPSLFTVLRVLRALHLDASELNGLEVH